MKLARYDDRFMAWLAPAARPARPWWTVRVSSPRLHRFLVAAGMQDCSRENGPESSAAPGSTEVR